MFAFLKSKFTRSKPSTFSNSAPSIRPVFADALAARGDVDPRVAEAMLRVPRAEFVPPRLRASAGDDRALSIGHRQTISQPTLVASMIAELRLPADCGRVLDVGTGSGYQAAILSRLAAEVVSVERIPALKDAAAQRLRRLGYCNVTVVQADEDTLGWDAAAPYDGIIVGAGAPRVPTSLVSQLAIGARLVIPVGDPGDERIVTVIRTPTGHEARAGVRCRFVPLIGPDAWQSRHDARDGGSLPV